MSDASLFDALITGNARKVMNELFPRGPQQPMSRYPDLVEGPSPAVDLGTAEVDDSNYDGAPWCSGCRARTAAGCKCGPIADNE